jgi:hypothetical protein
MLCNSSIYVHDLYGLIYVHDLYGLSLSLLTIKSITSAAFGRVCGGAGDGGLILLLLLCSWLVDGPYQDIGWVTGFWGEGGGWRV